MWPETSPLSRVAAEIGFAQQSAAAELGHAQADRVAVRRFGQPAHAIRRTLGHSSSTARWSLNFRPTTFGSRPVPLMSLPIRSISSTSTSRKRQPRQPAPGQHEQFLFAGFELLGPRRPRSAPSGRRRSRRWPGRPGCGSGEHLGRHAADDPLEAEILRSRGDRSSPLALAQPDQSIFISPLSIGPAKAVCGLTRLQTST